MFHYDKMMLVLVQTAISSKGVIVDFPLYAVRYEKTFRDHAECT